MESDDPVVANSLAVHRPVARCAVGVLLIELFVNRPPGNVCSSSTVVKDRCATLPVGLITLITVDVSSRDPVLAVDRLGAHVHVHVVDALKGQRLGLKDEEVDHGGSEEIAAEKDETEGVANACVGIGCQETDHEVAKPVERSGKRSLLSTSAERESLADDNPNERTPCGSERCDKHASAHDHDNAGVGVLGWRADNTNDGEDEQPSRLPESTDDKRHTATETLDHPESRHSHGDVDGTKNQLSLDGIINTSGFENRSSVVKEVID